eukprot:COSAG04_NODE_1901_length_5272_cov_89.011019_2_plen_99_part_00
MTPTRTWGSDAATLPVSMTACRRLFSLACAFRPAALRCRGHQHVQQLAQQHLQQIAQQRHLHQLMMGDRHAAFVPDEEPHEVDEAFEDFLRASGQVDA